MLDEVFLCMVAGCFVVPFFVEGIVFVEDFLGEILAEDVDLLDFVGFVGFVGFVDFVDFVSFVALIGEVLADFLSFSASLLY